MSSSIKKMANLLKSGAILLSDQCPKCSSPLFNIKGKIYCAKCEKPVQIISGKEDEERFKKKITLEYVEDILNLKLKEIADTIKSETRTDNLSEKISLISNYLDVLEKLKRLK